MTGGLDVHLAPEAGGMSPSEAVPAAEGDQGPNQAIEELGPGLCVRDWQKGGCYDEQTCLCGPRLVSSAGDAGCSESGLKDPECWLIPRSHKGCRLLEIAGRWP